MAHHDDDDGTFTVIQKESRRNNTGVSRVKQEGTDYAVKDACEVDRSILAATR